MLLHILNRGPDHQVVQQALSTMGPDDHLVLIEEAVTAVLAIQWEGWKIASDKISVLREDLVLRGLASDVGFYGTYNYHVIDINSLIELTAKYPKSITWH